MLDCEVNGDVPIVTTGDVVDTTRELEDFTVALDDKLGLVVTDTLTPIVVPSGMLTLMSDTEVEVVSAVLLADIEDRLVVGITTRLLLLDDVAKLVVEMESTLLLDVVEVLLLNSELIKLDIIDKDVLERVLSRLMLGVETLLSEDVVLLEVVTLLNDKMLLMELNL
ncbi:hypothetical protein LQW54_007400 [Pestalotiopsis sp. IQ-011]